MTKLKDNLKACLASIIVVALIKMMLEIRVIKGIFKKSKVEAVNNLNSFIEDED